MNQRLVQVVRAAVTIHQVLDQRLVLDVDVHARSRDVLGVALAGVELALGDRDLNVLETACVSLAGIFHCVVLSS
ncbi:MAG: hypothetical protein ACK55I_26470 [bacterium]